MRWIGRRQSANVDDRRHGRGLAVGGGLGGIVVVIIALLLGGDPRALLEQIGETGSGGDVISGEENVPAAADSMRQFVAVVLADTEDAWRDVFVRMNLSYREPTLVLFTDQVESACGFGAAAMGPFYCPADEHVYIDLGFYRDLRERFGAPGDFAQAYVIAHEVGHHVQNLLGTSDQVRAMQQRAGEREANALSVRLELQADFYAGIWARYAQEEGILDPGDIEEAMRAASAIGDDRLQKQSQGRVVPESFTHGTSEQRARWFRLGYETGDVSRGDTFSASDL
jgi:predicted metalloprotease